MAQADQTGPAVITVMGSAVVRAEPDEATVVVSVSTLSDAPGPALEDVTRRSRALIAILDELGVAAADRSTTGVGVGEEFDHTPSGRRSLGHRATSAVAVRLTDLDLIGRLVTRATTEVDARVSGPHWEIAADNPRRLDAARQASADAERKARAYAEGVGAALGELMRLAEREPAMLARRGPAKLMRAQAAAGGDMPVESGEQEIAAVVEATFALVL